MLSRESLEGDEETPCSVRHQHTVQSVVEVLVEATALGKFRQDSKGSTALPTSNKSMCRGGFHTVQRACVGDMRAARRAREQPGDGADDEGGSKPPAQASAGMTWPSLWWA